MSVPTIPVRGMWFCRNLRAWRSRAENRRVSGSGDISVFFEVGGDFQKIDYWKSSNGAMAGLGCIQGL